MQTATANTLAAFLRDRRARLDPTAFGFSGRRRTPGLRREEVAQRASISPTWYTWLEQGRGGAPSADVLDRIASSLMLTDLEREHLFMLGLGRPPEMHYKAAQGVSSRLQRLLDAFDACPAFIKTAFTPTCSVDTMVTVNQNNTALWGGSGSVKGAKYFGASTNGGAVKPAGDCPTTGCTQTQIDLGVTAGSTMGTSS